MEQVGVFIEDTSGEGRVVVISKIMTGTTTLNLLLSQDLEGVLCAYYALTLNHFLNFQSWHKYCPLLRDEKSCQQLNWLLFLQVSQDTCLQCSLVCSAGIASYLYERVCWWMKTSALTIALFRSSGSMSSARSKV